MKVSTTAALSLLLALSPAAAAADGKAIYEETCAACHGDNGAGNRDMQSPALAGQHDWYLLRQIARFREGTRGKDMEQDEAGAIMRGIAESMDMADLEAAALYAAGMPSPAPTPWQGGNIALGGGFYEICAACHGVHGEGNRAFDAPRLTGQDGQYLFDQLVKFRTGIRGGSDDDALAQQMKSMAEVLSDDDAIRSVVAYITKLSQDDTQ